MITSDKIKEMGNTFGADIVKIGDINLFDGTPKENDPRQIAPQAKTIIGLCFRILRGTLRGIEEGTQFFHFTAMGSTLIENSYAPAVCRKLACVLEDNGYEGAIQCAIRDRQPKGSNGVNAELGAVKILEYAKPVSEGKPAPDVIINFNQAAYICGFGEIGYGGFFLTPEFGPLQRFAFILTDAELESDPLFEGEALCDNCGKCIDACPGQAISKKLKTKLSYAGNEISHAEVNEWQCAAYYRGANRTTNPFMPPGAYDKLPDGEKIANGEKQLSPEEVKKLLSVCNSAYSGQYSICGRSCYRACLAHLEEKGALSRRFINKFRTKEPWSLTNEE